jgi:hypothetical protein
MLEGYGLTEAAPITHFNPIQGKRPPGSMGIPLPSTLAKIMDPETGNREMSPGEEGELVIQGPQVMDGYWHNPQETAMVLRDGWLYTGDLARMDEDGYFYIVERKKDLIIAGVTNLSRQLKKCSISTPTSEAAAFGVPMLTGGNRKWSSWPKMGPLPKRTSRSIAAACWRSIRCPRSSNFARCPKAGGRVAGAQGEGWPAGNLPYFSMTLRRILRYQWLKFLRLQEDPRKLAWGMALGVFIGITPTIPFHLVAALLWPRSSGSPQLPP